MCTGDQIQKGQCCELHEEKRSLGISYRQNQAYEKNYCGLHQKLCHLSDLPLGMVMKEFSVVVN